MCFEIHFLCSKLAGKQERQTVPVASSQQHLQQSHTRQQNTPKPAGAGGSATKVGKVADRRNQAPPPPPPPAAQKSDEDAPTMLIGSFTNAFNFC